MNPPPRSQKLILITLLMICASSAAGQTLNDPARAADATSQAGIGSSLFGKKSTNFPGLEEDAATAPESPGDADLGAQVILADARRRKAFTAWIDSSLFWTDNAFNIGGVKTEDWFYVGGLNLAWQQPLGGRFYADAYAGQHWYRYDDFTRLSYDFGELRFGILAVLPELRNAVLSLHYGYQRITDGIDNEELYEAHLMRLGLQKTFLIDHRNSIAAGVLASFATGTSPGNLQRHEYALQLSHHLKLAPKLNLSTAYRLSYFDYFNFQGRQDWYQNMGVSLNYLPSNHFEISLGYYFAVNSSNNSFFDYQTQLGGLSIAGKIRF
jgi:hypothetical protein